MIPIRLEITNFLSYEQLQVLDLHGIHLACISGPNGSGKSSLLDAITWSLFGKSRSKSDDNIVHSSAAAKGLPAAVNLIFELGGVFYRVERLKKVGKTAQLDFSVSSLGSSWKSLSEATIRDTQRSIEQVLRMNFDTFSNASFILQGKADNFTTSTPRRRKEVLGDLLGLEAWNNYKELANVRRREEENKLRVIDGRLADIDSELEEEPERLAELQDALTQVKEAKDRVISQTQLLDEQRQVESAIDKYKQLINALDENVASMDKSLRDSCRIRDQRLKERREYQELLENADVLHKKLKAWQSASDELHLWEKKSQQHSKLVEELRPLEIEIEKSRAQLLQRISELDAQAIRVARFSEEQADLAKALSRIRAQIMELEGQLLEFTAVENELQKSEKALSDMKAQRSMIDNELRLLREQDDRVQILRGESEKLLIDLQAAESKKSSISEQLSELSKLQILLTTRRGTLESAQKDQSRLRKEMDEIRENLTVLSELEGGLCPLCGQDLSDHHKKTVLKQLASDGRARGDQFRKNKDSIAAWGAEIAKISAELGFKQETEIEFQKLSLQIADITARVNQNQLTVLEWESSGSVKLEGLARTMEYNEEFISLEDSVAELLKRLGEKSALEERLANLKENRSRISNEIILISRTVAEWNEPGEGQSPSEMHEDLKEKLDKQQFAIDARSQFESISDQITQVGYNRTLHEHASKTLEELSEVPGKNQKLAEAETAVKHLDDILFDLDGQISAGEIQLSHLKEQYEMAMNNLNSLPGTPFERVELERDLQEKREEEIDAHRKAAAAQQNVDVLQKLKALKKQEFIEREDISRLIQRLAMLENSFGRDGVQSMLIERALPELEDDANYLLDRLSEGEMQIRFETQRPLKSGDRTVETLDIHISDSNGERPYENYSGGEQFRVNFAVRLALSKILTRRAGARLQTLVIDEGFGGQDPLGRQRLIESINMIQDDFERILVITHIDELRDAFPTQIRVAKGPTGSTIWVD